MTHKNLHIHSAPLVAFVVMATAVSVASVSGWRLQSLTASAQHPAIRLEATNHGYVKVMPNKHIDIADEQPGAVVEGLPVVGNYEVMWASKTANSVGLQLALDNAIR